MVDLIIIGGGPAGISAAIEAKRLGLDLFLIEKEKVGGALAYARKIENFPPFGPIPGRKLATLFEKRFAESEIKAVFDEVSKIIPGNGSFKILLSGKKSAVSKAVVMATGQSDSIPDDLKVYADIIGTCHNSRFKKGERTIVYGGGDVAVDQALLLKEKGVDVVLFCRSSVKAKKALMDDAKKEYLKIREWHNLTALTKTGKGVDAGFASYGNRKITVEADKIIFALGKSPHPPPIENFSSSEILDAGFSYYGETAINGLFFAGDIRRKKDRNVSIALSDGLLAANGVFKYLKGEKNV